MEGRKRNLSEERSKQERPGPKGKETEIAQEGRSSLEKSVETSCDAKTEDEKYQKKRRDRLQRHKTDRRMTQGSIQYRRRPAREERKSRSTREKGRERKGERE